jgi:type I protein arginine methyltransferase
VVIAAQNFTPHDPGTAFPVAPLRQGRGFPTWHFSMMNDHARNSAILEAISAIDLTDKVVFEIGTGAGLVAMYFARSGARHVYTCEMDEQLYKLAVQTIAQNGLSDRITVIHASSTEFIRSGAFDFSPDVIFTETLDCGVIGEGYANVSADIAAIARPDTIILPSEIRQYGFLVNSDDIAEQNCVGSSSELDLSTINHFSTRSYFPVRYKLFKSKTLSPTAELRRYTYLDKPRNADAFSLCAYASGTSHGIVSFFHAQFGDSVVSNDVRDTCHWHQAFHPFPEPLQVKSGRKYSFLLRPDGSISLCDG